MYVSPWHYQCPPSEPRLYLTSGESEKGWKLWEHVLQRDPLGHRVGVREREEGWGGGKGEDGGGRGRWFEVRCPTALAI